MRYQVTSKMFGVQETVEAENDTQAIKKAAKLMFGAPDVCNQMLSTFKIEIV